MSLSATKLSPTKLAQVDAIVAAVLYEGYLLYPYRASSVKNRQRWTFGGIVPPEYASPGESDRAEIRTQCLVLGTADAALEVHVRFLQQVDRSLAQLPAGPERSPLDSVSELSVDGRRIRPGQEAIERDVAAPTVLLGDLARRTCSVPFSFPACRTHDELRDAAGDLAGIVCREQQQLAGEVELSAESLSEGLFRLDVRVRNVTQLAGPRPASRDAWMRHSFASAHVVLGVARGEFVSLLDPPDDLAEPAAGCRQEGVWPVLVGEPGEANVMLASPIILYDYPQIAPESPGNLFDGTEIDEILSLRILTMTDAEKAEAATDDRARELVARTMALSQEQLAGLHGTWRSGGSEP